MAENDSFPFPNPHSMCFEDECTDRQKHNEVSEWEATADTWKKKSRRVMDPRLAVAKYRRSAAGVRSRPPRPLDSLETTLQHLFCLLKRQQPAFSETRKTLVSTVAFVDDRIRALQVDLVLSQTSCNNIQAQLVRYHVLILYLLSDVPSKRFEPKFANKAMWTAFGAYQHDRSCNQESEEMLCYSSLCKVASCLLREEAALPGAGGLDESSNVGYSSLLQQYNNPLMSALSSSSPAVFALKIASAAHLGLYRSVLSMLASQKATAFAVTCRCCMAPALNVLRIGALRQYNKCFGKGEKISGQEMERLLYLPSAQAALDFCESVGLPLHGNSHVVMKAAPISITDPTVVARMQSASRREDEYVFGSWYKRLDTSGNDLDLARIDEDSVLIPPGEMLEQLIRGKNSLSKTE